MFAKLYTVTANTALTTRTTSYGLEVMRKYLYPLVK